jgi:hypothetical protein
MAEYIEREAAIESLPVAWDSAINALRNAPSADVAPVVHGRWEWDTEDIYRCSNCAEKSHVKEVMGRPAWGYCPNCGARMDGDDDG